MEDKSMTYFDIQVDPDWNIELNTLTFMADKEWSMIKAFWPFTTIHCYLKLDLPD